MNGVRLFARYAYPPNRYGYCGPPSGWVEDALSAADRLELAQAARSFDGAWPYLELIGGLHGRDPLDRSVVEAYWLGNSLARTVDMLEWGNSLDRRFSARAGTRFAHLAESALAGHPTHAYHVLCVYPWVGLLRSGHSEPALSVIDQCRIRWARVASVEAGTATVVGRHMVKQGTQLTLGEPTATSVDLPTDGPAPTVGDVVSVHWGHVCQTLTTRQASNLRSETELHLSLVNRSTPGLIESMAP